MIIRSRGALDVQSYTNTWGQDFAKNDQDALTYDRMNAFLGEILYQPQWRAAADVEADYYDSNQYTAEDLSAMRDKGIPPIVVNLIAPTINMILGLEAKTRTDWIVKAELDQYQDAARAMSVKLKEAERMSRADQAISDAYAHQVKVGLGWVEVGYNKFDPFGYRYRCNFVHRREIWWDWHDDDPLLKQARYLVRRKWYDQDVALKYFPQHADLIKGVMSGMSYFDPTHLDAAPAMYANEFQTRDFCWGQEEWLDTGRKRLCIYEVWYRTVDRGFIIRYNNGKVAEFDDTNEVQKAAVMLGIAELEAAVFPKMRLSFWIGPNRLVDMPTPYPHQDFPYVPFWGFREDRTGAPYGMIRAMKPLQDEVNARRAKMMWQLSAKSVYVDQDATGDHRKLQQEIARPDAYVKINTMKGRRSIRDMIQVENNQSLTQQQFQVYEDSKQTLQDASGVFYQQLGKAQSGADSGVAISQLIEQGTTTLAKINDNEQVARMGVGNLLLSLIVKDMAGRQETVKFNQAGRTKQVKFNIPKVDGVTKKQYLDNDVTRMKASVVLSEVPQTPTYRMQQFQQLTQLVSSLPPQAQLALIDIVVNASDVPDKDEIIKRLRQTLNLAPGDTADMTPEEIAAYQQQQQQQQQIHDLQTQLAQSNAELQKARVGLTQAQTEKTLTESDAIKVDKNLDPSLSRSAGTMQPSGMTGMNDAGPDMAGATAPGTQQGGLAAAPQAPHTPPIQPSASPGMGQPMTQQ